MGEILVANGPDMDEQEARECIRRVVGHIAAATAELHMGRREIVSLHDRKGWKALGYKSWEACIEAEFPKRSRRSLYNDLRVGRFELEMDKGEPIEGVPDGLPYKALERLPRDQRKACWEAIQQRANGRKVVAKMVEQVVQHFIDETYLNERPTIRHLLPDHLRNVFDRDCLAFRDLSRPMIDEIERECIPETYEYLAECRRDSVKPGLTAKWLFAFSRQLDPRDCVICPDCKGSGHHSLIGECPLCYTLGYVTPRRADNLAKDSAGNYLTEEQAEEPSVEMAGV